MEQLWNKQNCIVGSFWLLLLCVCVCEGWEGGGGGGVAVCTLRLYAWCGKGDCSWG